MTDRNHPIAGRSDAHRGSGRERARGDYRQTPAQLSAQIRVLNDEVAQLRRRLAVAPTDTRPLERQLTESANRINALSERNEKLVVTLRDARAQLLQLKEEVDRLAQPPSGYGVFLSETARRTPSRSSPVGAGCDWPSRRPSRSDALQRGQQVRLNEALTVVEAGAFEIVGEVCALREVLVGRPGPRRRPRRRGTGGAARRAADGRPAQARRLPAGGRQGRLRLRAGAQGRGGGPRAGGGPGRRVRRHRRSHPADRADPRRGRAAVPARGPVPASTSCGRRRACCCTARPAAARR